jgi:hypothetical protein
VAQLGISGTVRNEGGTPVVGATLVLKASPEGSISAFAITMSDGSYKLRPPAFQDSLWLGVSHLNHADEGRWITPRDTLLNFVLGERVYELPTATVRQQAVIRRGDTLVFDVNQLREVGDENVEQLLRRIPGIEVEANGKILYQGLEISRFYIEGLDMLEGRYALATRNLSPDAIRDVEILERHQPIRALDSLVTPPNAAINLRLKSKLALTGNLRAGLGAAPRLHLAEATLFGFAKRQQFSLLGSTNNVGNAIGDNFRDLYRPENFSLPLVRASEVQIPLGLATTNYLDNNETTGGFNFLRKIGADTQFKWNGFAARDRIRTRGRRELTFQDSDNLASITEELNTLARPVKFNNRLALELNAERLYLKNSLEAEYGRTRTTVDNFFNGAANPEAFEYDDLSLRARLSGILRRGQRAYRLEGKIDYTDEHYELGIQPLLIIAPDIAPFRLAASRQLARQQRLTTNWYSNLVFRRGDWSGETRLGLRGERTLLASNLTDGEENSLGPAFLNDNRQGFFAPYVQQYFEHQRPERSWKLSLPLATHFFGFQNFLNNQRMRRELLVLRPELSYIRRLKQQRILSFSYTYALDYRQNEELFTGYILRQNRFFDRRLPNVNRTRKHLLTAAFRGANAKQSFRYQTTLQAEAEAADLLTRAVFDTTGQAAAQIQRRNVRRNLKLSNRFEFSGLPNTTATLVADYSITSLPLALNGADFSLTLHQLSLTPDLSYAFANSAISLQSELIYLNNTFIADAALQLAIRLGYYRELGPKWGGIRLSFFRQSNYVGTQKVSNTLINLHWKRPVFSDKFEFSIHLNNLANANNFVSFTQQSFSEELAFYRLRNRQILFVLTKKI